LRRSWGLPLLPRLGIFGNSAPKIRCRDLDLQPHVDWLLSGVTPGRRIGEICRSGCQAKVAVFRASSGRGGGPVISEKLLRALAEQNLPLEFDFYAEEVEASNSVVH